MKLLVAFVAGAALAGGLVFVTLRPPAAVVSPLEAERPPLLDLTVPEEPPLPEAVASVPKAPPRPQRRPFHPPSPAPVRVAQAALPEPPPVEAAPAVVAAEPAIPAVLVSTNEPPPPPEPNRVDLTAGAVLNIILAEDLSSEKNVVGDLFTASLGGPLVIDGFVIADRGARVEGRVVDARRSGKVKGAAALVLELSNLETADGQIIPIETDPFTKRARRGHVKDAAKVGAAASVGAIIGAAVSGGSGAAIGAAIGGGAATGGVLLTRGAPAYLPAESRLPFRVSRTVTITERIY